MDRTNKETPTVRTRPNSKKDKSARRHRSDTLVWTRLEHEGLGMPCPGIYLPETALTPFTPAMWGFERMTERPADAPLPYARGRDGSWLAADVNDPTALSLLIAPADCVTAAGSAGIRIDAPRVLATGPVDTPHPPQWQEAAYTARTLLLLTGPSPLPALMRDQQLSDLWIFHSSIAVVPLVQPAYLLAEAAPGQPG